MPLIDDGFEALLEPFYNGKKLTDPISTKEDKYQLLPAFLKVKGESSGRHDAELAYHHNGITI
jgi:DNA-directed RNA polymerase III subunit RPC2